MGQFSSADKDELINVDMNDKKMVKDQEQQQPEIEDTNPIENINARNNYQTLIAMGFDEQLATFANNEYKNIDECIQFILNDNNVTSQNSIPKVEENQSDTLKSYIKCNSIDITSGTSDNNDEKKSNEEIYIKKHDDVKINSMISAESRHCEENTNCKYYKQLINGKYSREMLTHLTTYIHKPIQCTQGDKCTFYCNSNRSYKVEDRCHCSIYYHNIIKSGDTEEEKKYERLICDNFHVRIFACSGECGNTIAKFMWKLWEDRKSIWQTLNKAADGNSKIGLIKTKLGECFYLEFKSLLLAHLYDNNDNIFKKTINQFKTQPYYKPQYLVTHKDDIINTKVDTFIVTVASDPWAQFSILYEDLTYMCLSKAVNINEELILNGYEEIAKDVELKNHINELLNHPIHVSKGKPLNYEQMFSIFLYTSINDVYRDLRLSNLKFNFCRWKYTQWKLYEAIRILSETQSVIPKKLYHGLYGIHVNPNDFISSCVFVTFVSTSWQYAVAQNFAHGDGCIICFEDFDGICADVSWISRFSAECEILMVPTTVKLKVIGDHQSELQRLVATHVGKIDALENVEKCWWLRDRKAKIV
eukprot:479326_1